MRGHAPGQPVRPGTVTEDSIWPAAQDPRADTCSSDKERARTCKTLGPDIKKKGRAVFRRLHSSRDMPPRCGVHTKVSEAGRSGDANNPRRPRTRRPRAARPRSDRRQRAGDVFAGGRATAPPGWIHGGRTRTPHWGTPASHVGCRGFRDKPWIGGAGHGAGKARDIPHPLEDQGRGGNLRAWHTAVSLQLQSLVLRTATAAPHHRRASAGGDVSGRARGELHQAAGQVRLLPLPRCIGARPSQNILSCGFWFRG
jgi:hypothetical protein